MKGLKMPSVHDMHPNVTPLIDIVMCLIIFFMLVARIGVDVGDVPMNLPYSNWGKKIEDRGNAVTLNLESGKVRMLSRDGRSIDTYNLPEPNANGVIDRTRPSERLKKVLEQYRKDNEDVKVIIRADQNIQYQYIEPILVICAQAKMKNFNFAAKREDY